MLDEWRDREQELLDRLKLPFGPIAAEERVPTLNGMVAESFTRFEQVVATLSPAGLLEALVAYGERLIQIQEHELRLSPMRVACFGTVQEAVEEMQRDGPILPTTAIAHRFVTEYVVARPPSGLRPFSLEAYDELIALAALLAGWGLDSDAIHYSLADPRLTVLESGRLGRSATEYEAAVEGFAGRAKAEQIARSSAAFSWMFQSPADPAPGPPITASEFDEATEAEFGISITRIAEFTDALIEIGSEQPGPTKRLPERETRERAASVLRWSDVELDAAFSLLTLEPRAQFLDSTHRVRPSRSLPVGLQSPAVVSPPPATAKEGERRRTRVRVGLSGPDPGRRVPAQRIDRGPPQGVQQSDALTPRQNHQPLWQGVQRPSRRGL